MSDPLQGAVLNLVEAHAKTGVTMGKIVDRLVADGGNEQEVELAIWDLIQRRRLTPNGFVCRKVRKPSQSGATAETRTYEFVLIPWSPALDAQLDLNLDINLDISDDSALAGTPAKGAGNSGR